MSLTIHYFYSKHIFSFFLNTEDDTSNAYFYVLFLNFQNKCSIKYLIRVLQW